MLHAVTHEHKHGTSFGVINATGTPTIREAMITLEWEGGPDDDVTIEELGDIPDVDLAMEAYNKANKDHKNPLTSEELSRLAMGLQWFEENFRGVASASADMFNYDDDTIDIVITTQYKPVRSNDSIASVPVSINNTETRNAVLPRTRLTDGEDVLGRYTTDVLGRYTTGEYVGLGICDK